MTAPATPLCSIIIPVFNKWELTRACLESLRLHTSNDTCEIIVVDNGSDDDTAQHLESVGATLFGAAFRHIRSAENRNFAPACNAGANAANADMLFFLNNDTLMTPEWFSPLYQSFADTPQQGATGPLLLYADHTVQHLGVTFSPDGIFHLYQGFPKQHPAVAKQRPLQAITAAALMLPKQLFFNCGAFHEEYRNGYEDIELSCRIRQQGKTLTCTTASHILHLESQTPGRHANLRHNFELLHARCADAFHVDMHTLAMQDGFSVVLDDLLELRILVSLEQSRDMLHSEAAQSLQSLYDLAMQNPCWREGHQVLAELLEEAGAFDEAIRIRIRLVNQMADRNNANQMMKLLEKRPDTGLANAVRRVLERIDTLTQHPQQQVDRCARNIAMARHMNDKTLESLYTRALQSIKQQILR